MPFGYAVFDALSDGLLLQSSIAEGTSGLVQSIRRENDPMTYSESDAEETVVMGTPLQFGLVDKAAEVVAFNNGEEIELSDLPLSSAPQTVDPIQWDTIMIDENEVRQGKYQMTNADFLYDYNYATESEVEAYTGKYACAVSALYSIGGTLYTSSGPLIECQSDWGEYQKIWNYTETYQISSSANGIVYGATKNGKIGSGFKSYCSSRGYEIDYTYSASRPAYVRFKDQVSQQRHSIFTGEIVRSLPGGGSELSGHAMAVYGWGDIQKGDFPISNLFVFDGWNRMVFLNYSYTGFQSATGTFFNQ